MTTDRTRRTRLARALAAVADIGYQDALALVNAAAEAGRLPAQLDRDGIRRALDLLLADIPPQPVPASEPASAPVPAGTGRRNALDLEGRYHRMHELPGFRLHPAAAAHAVKAQAAGVAPVVCRGTCNPVDELGALGTPDDDPDRDAAWWRRLVAAGERPEAALTCPYPPGDDPDGYLPIDRALDARDVTGDVDGYEKALYEIIAAEPRDIDAVAAVDRGGRGPAAARGRGAGVPVRLLDRPPESPADRRGDPPDLDSPVTASAPGLPSGLQSERIQPLRRLLYDRARLEAQRPAGRPAWRLKPELFRDGEDCFVVIGRLEALLGEEGLGVCAP